MKRRFLIPLPDFVRIHQTIYSILMSEKAETLQSCFLFSMFGTHILRRHYGIEATVRAGVAAYRLGTAEQPALLFAEVAGDELRCTDNGFHAWVEADGWLLDFMSPLFSQMTDVPAKMLQKKLSTGVDSFSALAAQGDFFLRRHPGIEQSLLEQFSSKPANLDLLQIAADWYQRPPKPIKKALEILDQDGAAKKMSLIRISPSGIW